MNGRQLLLSLISFLVLLASAMTAFLWWQRDVDIDLVLTTGQSAGTYFPLGKLIADAVAETDPRIQIKVIESAGSLENMRRLGDKSADLAIVQNDTAPCSPRVRTLIPLHRGVFHFLARTDAGIESIRDLRGKRVALGPPGSGSLHIVREMFRHFGVSEEEVDASYEGIGESVPKLLEGELDAMLTMASVDSSAIQRLMDQGDITYVSLGDHLSPGNVVEGFAITYPYIDRFTIPQAVHPTVGRGFGQPESPCATFAIRAALICREDLPANVARSIVAAIVSHRAGMLRANRAATDISEQFSPRDVQFPLHDGAVAYYQRRQPGFLERYAEPMAFLLSVVLASGGLLAALAKWITLRKKNRIDVYYSRLDALLTELNDSETTDTVRLHAIDNELLIMRHDAVRELVNERLMADESFQIFQSLLTECQNQVAAKREKSLMIE